MVTSAIIGILLHLVGLGSAVRQVEEWGVPGDLAPAIVYAAVRTPLPLDRALAIWTAVGWQESNWKAAPPRNRTGCGIFQVVPVKWGRPGCAALEDPIVCADWGARILAGFYAGSHGKLRVALYRYNGGATAGYVEEVIRRAAKYVPRWCKQV